MTYRDPPGACTGIQPELLFAIPGASISCLGVRSAAQETVLCPEPLVRREAGVTWPTETITLLVVRCQQPEAPHCPGGEAGRK